MESGKCYHFAREMGQIYLTRSVYLPTLKEHFHDYIELVCITKGRGLHHMGGVAQKVSRGDILVINCSVLHNYEALSENFEWINY